MNYYLITNSPEKALLYEDLGVNFIMIDLEQLGKEERQNNLDTVKNFHTIEDIRSVRKVIRKSKLVVRINPINPESESEIDEVLKAGVDIIMLPFFKKPHEVRLFYELLYNKNIQTILLFEHIEALRNFDLILNEVNLDQLDAIHFGLNDLSISMKVDFMFSILAMPVLNKPINKCIKRNIKFGIGGIAGVSGGKIPGEIILKEYIRLGACRTILSRSFQKDYKSRDEIGKSLSGLKKITMKKHSSKSLDANYNLLIKLLN